MTRKPSVRWWIAGLPVVVMGAALVVVHLAHLPAQQEQFAQGAIVLIGFVMLALWVRANEDAFVE
jgi:hypothetical protein